ncbi:FAD/NAD(P)-binding domain-containing protein [Pleomassaria siparia CBS 279.74]|uniref:FAD/NAD(P)-binding domain-containing protein n=1 Tax=Pleomassaria siparia CBS 279.74 TaxID=1314801 RepID=A0A6G1KBU6_9PLEO|nr:FAD/NAD(P)-binding domain-containing protein [Pleomassaria siparia CBS 279.74]
MPIEHAIIIGGGITGIAAALVLTKYNRMTCSIYEIKLEPATIGGAINLTPNALRYLDHLGVLPRLMHLGCRVKYIEIASLRTGQQLGTMDFDNVEKFKHGALRVMRHDLLSAMLATLGESGVQVQYGKKVESVVEDDVGIIARFEDGMTVEGDILLGCDGIHSAVRTKFIQPERTPEYTGVANAYGLLNATDLRDTIPINSTTLFFGRLGSLLPANSRLYFSAVMGTQDVGSREGWTVKSMEQDALKEDLSRRFSGSTLPMMDEILRRISAIALYPVYRLSENGIWSSGRMLLLGDAAHAMPAQGESVGLALEDVVLLSRILEQDQDVPVQKLFQHYDTLRRTRINAAVEEANFGFETIKDRGWAATVLMEWLTWIVLAWRASRKEKEFEFDVRDIELGL